MKQSLIVTSILSKINLPKTKLENQVNRNNKVRCEQSQVAEIEVPGFENISWRFMHIPVTGDLELAFMNPSSKKVLRVTVPASTGFLAACTKGSKGNFKFTSGISLS